ncbi:MAG: rhomboid family intramembrane serine protease [Kiritimatiellia bacterium]|nr:rhomboid family intramembrane serine protease [Kiritimatiellia bacterium]
MEYREYMVRNESVSGGITPVVRRLLWINVGFFFAYQILFRRLLMPWTGYLALSRYGLTQGYFWQPLTYLFLHANLTHLAMNMLGLYFMGPDTERTLGSRRFLFLYLFSGILGGIGFVLLNASAPCIGASGAVYGILAAFAALYPNRRVTFLLFPFISFRAWTLALVYGAIEFLSALNSEHGGGIAHSAHLAGGLAGWIYTKALLAGAGGPRPTLGVLRWFSGLTRRTPGPREIDRILDKVATRGLHSLSARERNLLDRASRGRSGRG